MGDYRHSRYGNAHTPLRWKVFRLHRFVSDRERYGLAAQLRRAAISSFPISLKEREVTVIVELVRFFRDCPRIGL